MSEPIVLSALQGGVLRLTLNRPAKLNIFTRAMLAELRSACSGLISEYGLEGNEGCYCGAAEQRSGNLPLAGLDRRDE